MKKHRTENQEVEKEQKAAAQENGADAADTAQEKTDTVAEADKVTPEEEIAQWKDKFARLQADFDNYRKRTLKEKMDLVSTASEGVIKDILPILDDMERAVAASEKATEISSVAEGEKLILQKFVKVMESKGVKEIEAKGLEFNEENMDAVARFAAGEENKGKVIDVTEKGYTLSGKVIRFSKVVVGE